MAYIEDDHLRRITSIVSAELCTAVKDENGLAVGNRFDRSVLRNAIHRAIHESLGNPVRVVRSATTIGTPPEYPHPDMTVV